MANNSKVIDLTNDSDTEVFSDLTNDSEEKYESWYDVNGKYYNIVMNNLKPWNYFEPMQHKHLIKQTQFVCLGFNFDKMNMTMWHLDKMKCKLNEWTLHTYSYNSINENIDMIQKQYLDLSDHGKDMNVAFDWNPNTPNQFVMSNNKYSWNCQLDFNCNYDNLIIVKDREISYVIGNHIGGMFNFQAIANWATIKFLLECFPHKFMG